MRSSVTVSLVPEARGGPFVFWDDLPLACREAGRLRFDAIEIFPPSADAVDGRQLQDLLNEHNLHLAAVGTGAGWVKHRLHVALGEERQRRAARDFIRSIVDFAGKFSAPAIIGSMQGRSGDGVDGATARSYLCDALEELGEHARQYGAPLLYEPLNRYETNQVNCVSDGLALLGGLSTSNVKLLCDLFHMNIEEADIGAALKAAGDKLGHVHFVDSNRRPIGMGHLDMPPIIAALRESNYTGYLSAEALSFPDSLPAAEQTIASFRRLVEST